MPRRIVLALTLIFAASVSLTSYADPAKPLVPRRAANKHGPKLPADTKIESVVIKFHEGTHVRLRGDHMVSLPSNGREEERLTSLGLTDGQIDRDLRSVRALIASRRLERLFSISEDVLAARRTDGEARSGQELADLDLYYRVPLGAGATQADVDSLVSMLNALPSVEIAYAQPFPSHPAVDIPPTTPNYQSNQGYLNAAPDGISATYAWTRPGGRGQSVSVVDMEGAWRTTHEDFPPLFHQGGTPINDLGYRNHGTAVLGIIGAPDNGYGVTGIANQASFGVESFGVQGITTAITNAAIAAGTGGIVVIELSEQGPATPSTVCCYIPQCDFVPMEFEQANFDAITTATANGTTVVEAAANGSSNLDDPVYNGVFDRTVRDSGAILVGAGDPSGHYGLCFSNYGSRLDVQGWGQSVTTLGTGDLFNGGGDEDQYYTAAFAGTSSATPIVTGAAASLIGVSLAAGQGVGYRSPKEIRSILATTGTPQTPNAQNAWIGPLPDLSHAIPRVLDLRPVASFTITCTGVACNADASASSDAGPMTYAWNWGDSSTSSGGPTTSHTFAAAGNYTVTLTVTDSVGQTGTTTRSISLAPPTTPGSFTATAATATAATATSVNVTWTASTSSLGIAYYRVERRGSLTGAWTLAQITSATSFTDSSASAGSMYQYRIAAIDNAGTPSAYAYDYATTVLFGADLQRYTSVITGAHIRDLRNAVDAWRFFAGSTDVYPANPTPTGVIKLANFITNTASDPLPGVVTALNEARSAMSLPVFSYAGVPAPAAGGTVLVEHVQQLRDAMK
jgi:serine protease